MVATEVSRVFQSIDRTQVQQLLTGGAQIVEVLEAQQYRLAHLPGARHIPGWEMTRSRVAELDPERPVVVYCYDNL